jgi:hypothetical protein
MDDVTPLVDLEDARRHVRIVGVTQAEDYDLQAKLAVATAFVVRAAGDLADPTWTESTVPPAIHQAILLLLTELYTDRGDDPARKAPFGEHVIQFLFTMGYKDPAVA